jgi:hypothetical protein
MIFAPCLHPYRQGYQDGMEASMARPRKRPLGPSDIEGLEYFDTLVPVLARL